MQQPFTTAPRRNGITKSRTVSNCMQDFFEFTMLTVMQKQSLSSFSMSTKQSLPLHQLNQKAEY